MPFLKHGESHHLKNFLLSLQKFYLTPQVKILKIFFQFPNTLLQHHKDEDEMVSININLLDTIPVIHLEHKPYPYQCALFDVGHVMHGVEPDPNPRLILKFCLRHPYEEVWERLNKFDLLRDEITLYA